MLLEDSKTPEYIDRNEARKILCYKDASSFRRAVIDLDIPRYHINSRKVLFRKEELLRWLESRKEGHVPSFSLNTVRLDL